MSTFVMIVAVTLKLYEFKVQAIDFYSKCLQNAAMTLTEVKLIGLMYVGYFLKRCIFSHDKYLPNPFMIVCATFKCFECEKFL